ncbi:MAG TPA: hypothetical protein VK716_11810 [Terracidiphilus sp.]|nr:hypothetical protein [Terracidiphilus sp.]
MRIDSNYGENVVGEVVQDKVILVLDAGFVDPAGKYFVRRTGAGKTAGCE